MKARMFWLAALVSLSIIVTAGLSAQTPPDMPGGWLGGSPTSSTTRGLFATDADDFIDPAGYSNVEFENRYIMGSFKGAAGANAQAFLGYAQKFGSVYVGLFYGGFMGRGYSYPEYTEMTHEYGGPNNTKSVIALATAPDLSDMFIYNNEDRIAVLVGIADMGFRFSLASSRRSFKESDVMIISDGTSYSDYLVQYGWLVPELAWGMASPLLEAGIQPTARVELGFFKDYEAANAYNADYSNTLGEMLMDDPANVTRLTIEAAMGAYDFHRGEALTIGADFSYALSVDMRNNEYGYWDGTTYKTGTIKGEGIQDLTGQSISEQTDWRHTITPNLILTYNAADNLTFKARFDLPLQINSGSNTPYVLHTDSAKAAKGELVQAQSAYTSTTETTLSPSLSLAMQYKILSDRLFINFGGHITPASFSWETVNSTVWEWQNNDPDNGRDRPNSETKRKTRTTENGIINLQLGLTWNITDNAALDVVTGVTNAGPANSVNVFGSGTNNIATFGQLLFGLKF